MKNTRSGARSTGGRREGHVPRARIRAWVLDVLAKEGRLPERAAGTEPLAGRAIGLEATGTVLPSSRSVAEAVLARDPELAAGLLGPGEDPARALEALGEFFEALEAVGREASATNARIDALLDRIERRGRHRGATAP